jgi:hypothetical protein
MELINLKDNDIGLLHLAGQQINKTKKWKFGINKSIGIQEDKISNEPRIIKYGNIVHDNNIFQIVQHIIEYKLTLDKTSNSTDGCHHLATFFSGPARWREKGGFWRKFST